MSSHDDIEAAAAAWLARRDAGEWSDTQQSELDAWLVAATAHRIAFLRLESVWKRTDRLSALKVPRADRSVARAHPPRWRAAAWPLISGLGAAVLLIVVGGYRWLTHDDFAFHTSLGERRPIVLADGTHVLLNTDTRLEAEVDPSRRLVRLDRGEAYFEVTHDAAHPFVVNAGDCTITVLGTKFIVRRDAGSVRVTVLDGRVRVTPRDDGTGDHTMILTANDLAVATPTAAIVSHETTEQTAKALSWRTGRLSFDNVTLEAAALEFNRYNERKLVVVDGRAAQLRIGGSFDATNVEAFVRLLHAGFGLNVHEDGRSILVSG